MNSRIPRGIQGEVNRKSIIGSTSKNVDCLLEKNVLSVGQTRRMVNGRDLRGILGAYPRG